MKDRFKAFLKARRSKREFDSIKRDMTALKRMGEFRAITKNGDEYIFTLCINGCEYHWHAGTVHRYLIANSMERRYRTWRSRYGLTAA